MTPVQSPAPARPASRNAAYDWMGQDSLKAICAASGPFITAYLPARHPGAADSPHSDRMRTIIADAARELERRRFQGPIGTLLKPLETLAESPASHAGGSDSAVFLSPGFFRHVRLLAPTRGCLIVASHAHITPVLAHRIPERVVYLLAITKKLLRLCRWEDGQFTEIPLPAAVPKSFEETLVLDQPDHDLQNRSAAGPSSAQVGPARFGTGSERDEAHERLRSYLRFVDRELAGSLQGAPLILVGIAQELAAYRAVSEYAHVVAAKPASPGHLTCPELKELGEEAMLDAQRGEARKALVEFQATSRRDHISSEIRQVLEAAREGRVHKLLSEEVAEEEGLLGPSFPMDSAHVEGEQDLVNAAAVETIRGRGEVQVLPHGELGGTSHVAAILRYAVRPVV